MVNSNADLAQAVLSIYFLIFLFFSFGLGFFVVLGFFFHLGIFGFFSFKNRKWSYNYFCCAYDVHFFCEKGVVFSVFYGQQ